MWGLDLNLKWSLNKTRALRSTPFLSDGLSLQKSLSDRKKLLLSRIIMTHLFSSDNVFKFVFNLLITLCSFYILVSNSCLCLNYLYYQFSSLSNFYSPFSLFSPFFSLPYLLPSFFPFSAFNRLLDAHIPDICKSVYSANGNRNCGKCVCQRDT